MCNLPVHNCTGAVHMCNARLRSCSRVLHLCNPPLHLCAGAVHLCKVGVLNNSDSLHFDPSAVERNPIATYRSHESLYLAPPFEHPARQLDATGAAQFGVSVERGLERFAIELAVGLSPDFVDDERFPFDPAFEAADEFAPM